MTTIQALWIAFLLGQIVNGGHINHQQDIGMYEINPVYHVYGDTHPSNEQVWLMKGAGTLGVWGATKLLPEHKKKILAAANVVVWGFIAADVYNAGFSWRF